MTKMRWIFAKNNWGKYVSHTGSLVLIIGHSRKLQIRLRDQQRRSASIRSLDGSGQSTTRNTSSDLQILPIHHKTQQFVERQDPKKPQRTPWTLWQIQGMATCKPLKRLRRWTRKSHCSQKHFRRYLHPIFFQLEEPWHQLNSVNKYFELSSPEISVSLSLRTLSSLLCFDMPIRIATFLIVGQ